MVCKKIVGYYPQKVKIENSLLNFLPVQKGVFQEIACPKKHAGPVLAKSLLSQWHSGKIVGLSAGRHGVQCSIPGRGK